VPAVPARSKGGDATEETDDDARRGVTRNDGGEQRGE